MQDYHQSSPEASPNKNGTFHYGGGFSSPVSALRAKAGEIRAAHQKESSFLSALDTGASSGAYGSFTQPHSN
jgi:hypothetical protein